MRFSEQHPLALLAVVGLLSMAIPDTTLGDDAISVDIGDSTVLVIRGDRPVFSYRFDDVPHKPYVEKLFTPGGTQILRDSPDDHVHHHALMFALVVDGIDFWSEKPVCGKQLSGRCELTSALSPDSDEMSFVALLRWMAPEDETPLLLEERTLELHSIDGSNVTLLTWSSQLEPGPGHDVVTITGTHYDGLGMRFVESMDKEGCFLHANGKPGPIVRGQERVTPSRWTAYTASVEGHRVTVAIFDDPANPRHPAGMFTMSSHFAYLSATPNVWKKPLDLKSGSSLKLRYGVALWDGEVEPDTIDQLYQQWHKH